MRRTFLILIFFIVTASIIYSATPANTTRAAAPAAGATTGRTNTTAAANTTATASRPAAPLRIPADPSSLKKELYREVKLETDFTLKLVNKINENQIGDGDSFIVATYNAKGRLKSIACYNKERKLSLYVLNEKLNMFFYYITFEYSDDLVKSYTLRDQSDQKFWQVKFDYDASKSIVKSEILRREITTGELKKLFHNQYKYYSGKKMFLHTLYDANSDVEEKTYYTNSGLKKRYERYVTGGKRLQYYIVHFYNGNKETKREVYSATDVLLEVISLNESVASADTGTQNRPVGPSTNVRAR